MQPSPSRGFSKLPISYIPRNGQGGPNFLPRREYQARPPRSLGYNHRPKRMPGLSFEGVTKSFGAVRALKGVTFPVNEGESHALVGENGAGKSTLMRVLAGILRPDSGALVWDGRRLDLHSPRAALDQGIGMVYQEMLLFPNLSVSG